MGFYVTGSSFQARPTLSSNLHRSPAIWARSCTIVTRMRPIHQDLGPSTPSYDVTLCIRTSSEWRPPYHTNGVRHYSDRIQPVPVHGRPPLFSVPGGPLVPDGPTACLTRPIGRGRGYPDTARPPLHTTHRLAEERPSISPPS
jgi:hypothetical protein